MSAHTSLSCGVYVIEQVGADRYYIGSSKSIGLRWYQHRKLLREGKHHSSFLQNAWNKHGEAAFKFWVIENCLVDELLEKEQQYMDALSPAFNVCPIARSRLGSKQRPEVAEKIRASVLARAAAITHCPNGHEYTPENRASGKRSKTLCRECARIRSRKAIEAETAEQKADRLRKCNEYHRRNREHRLALQREYVARTKEQKRAYDRDPVNRARKQERRARARAEGRAYG